MQSPTQNYSYSLSSPPIMKMMIYDDGSTSSQYVQHQTALGTISSPISNCNSPPARLLYEEQYQHQHQQPNLALQSPPPPLHEHSIVQTPLVPLSFTHYSANHQSHHNTATQNNSVNDKNSVSFWFWVFYL